MSYVGIDAFRSSIKFSAQKVKDEEEEDEETRKLSAPIDKKDGENVCVYFTH